eukprot:CAMPEP_0115028812 /NCGR_PEP_ID=MMETSP0216-20121206/36574_1 /TAXON_ID=223996 /ORGANISM="Protocruzia adherens, Strain Boccale" /LENGTH=1250 /DNA_ID=CAMNT_0002405169 /DNA_START=45 /DNA_END=3797 /DNA_ORIENTATION=-
MASETGEVNGSGEKQTISAQSTAKRGTDPNSIQVELTTTKKAQQESQGGGEKRCFDLQIQKGEQATLFMKNKISTAKYNVITFLPKNLWEQFHKLANVYFLVIAVMQVIPQISITDGQPLILVPLVLVLAISAIKDLIEDLKRHKSDNEENTKKVLRYDQNGNEIEVGWQDIKVGDFIKVRNDEFFPADLVMLYSSEETAGIGYVETRNLDGETNLKPKKVEKKLGALTKEGVENKTVHKLDAMLTCQVPNERIYEFNGFVTFPSGEKVALNVDQMLLRGSSLRNTDFVIAFVVYTGHESKIMLNSSGAKPKHSRIERTMNKQIIIIFILQVALCVFCGIFYAVWFSSNKDDTDYLGWEESGDGEENALVVFFLQMGTWMLLFANFVPISLIVTLEVVKFIQAIFIVWDEEVCDKPRDLPAKVQSSNLNEEIGQVEYVFSDKTGTLTCNIMEYKKMSINGISYGNDKLSGENLAAKKGITNVAFEDATFEKDMKNEANSKFLKLLALCHTVLVETKKGEERKFGDTLKYQASSPDELALVNIAQYCGVRFLGVSDAAIMSLDFFGTTEKYEILEVLEFSSARKRMSIILRDHQADNIILYCKGADSIIVPRLRSGQDQLVHTTNEHLDEYAKTGLRTLLVAQKVISLEEYAEWKKGEEKAQEDVNNREARLEEVYDQIERGMDLIGATAIEDRLQDQVGATIASLKEAGIKVWVLTGDKVETAINIGFSSQLLNDEMYQAVIDANSTSVCKDDFRKHIAEIKKEIADCNKDEVFKAALVISGDALTCVLGDDTLRDLMSEMGDLVDVVIACRVSPKQKAEVVRLVRGVKPDVVTLAIGDGANDVNMITAAHIGVGIAGLEGQQAVRASDYAIGQFRFLRRLLFYHGRECYRRNAYLVCYNFYKNVIFVMPAFWFGFYSSFSGQPIYDSWIYQIYNVFFTSLPILIYAIFDKQFDDPVRHLENRPINYRLGMEYKLFNTIVFWKWVAYASVQALYIQATGFDIFTASVDEDGTMIGLWGAGAVIYGAVVLVANFKLLHFSYSHYWFSVGSVVASLAVYFVCVAIMSSIEGLQLSGVNPEIMGTGRTYFAWILICGLSIALDMALWRLPRPPAEEEGEIAAAEAEKKKKEVPLDAGEPITRNPKHKVTSSLHHVSDRKESSTGEVQEPATLVKAEFRRGFSFSQIENFVHPAYRRSAGFKFHQVAASEIIEEEKSREDVKPNQIKPTLNLTGKKTGFYQTVSLNEDPNESQE